jgi:hypothetical protein
MADHRMMYWQRCAPGGRHAPGPGFVTYAAMIWSMVGNVGMVVPVDAERVPVVLPGRRPLIAVHDALLFLGANQVDSA